MTKWNLKSGVEKISFSNSNNAKSAIIRLNGELIEHTNISIKTKDKRF